MAKKKRKHHVTRRRRVGAASGMQAVIMKAAGIAGGAFAGGLITKAAGTLNPKILGGGLLVGGTFVAAKFAKGNPLIEGLGYGLAAKGANSLLVSFGVISGIGSAMPGTYFRGATNKNLSGVMSNPIGALNNTGRGVRTPVGGFVRNPIGSTTSRQQLGALGALFDN